MTAPKKNTAVVPAADDGEEKAPARVAETASVSAAAQARAAVEARYLMALKNPRSFHLVRSKILEACKRPGFAATARYEKPLGGSQKVVGPSIRFAEEALRAMGNTLIERTVIFDEGERRIVRITVTDLEANLSYPHDLMIEKTVERQYVRDGMEVLGTRNNTKGEKVYIVRATEDQMFTKESALASKAIRAGALRMLPSDILEEAMELVVSTLKDADASDPKAAVKKIVDAFYDLGVDATQLAEFIGHPIESCSPAEINRLRLVYQAIKQGETTWAEVWEVEKLNRNGLEKIRAEREGNKTEPAAGAETPKATPPKGLASRVAKKATAIKQSADSAYEERMQQLAAMKASGAPLSDEELDELRQWQMDKQRQGGA